MTLPYTPEKDADLFMELDRRIVNVEGKIGGGLSHKDLKDIEDHKAFLKQDGSIPVTGTLDFTKAGRIKNSANRILDVDIYQGIVRLDEDLNQLTVDPNVPDLVQDHGSLLGLADDDHTQYLLANGNRALTGDWDAGSFKITAEQLESDIATGTTPLIVASTTKVTNLNADLLDDLSEAAFILTDGTRAFTGSVTIGNGAAGVDYSLTFDGETNDGVLTWMEDEDYFKFSDDIALNDTEFIIFDKASGNGIKIDTTTPTFGWRDLLGQPTALNVGASKPTFTTYRDTLLQFQFGVGDEEYFEFHIPHDYVLGTDIHLHIHWSHIGTLVTGGTVTFEYEIGYAKGHDQAAFGASVGTTFNGTASTTQYQHIITEIQISAGTPDANQIDSDDLEPDGVIITRFELNANNITVSGGGVPDPFVHYVDIHYQSTNISTKEKAPDFYA